jgi:fibro-slime domain-containing protein
MRQSRIPVLELLALLPALGCAGIAEVKAGGDSRVDAGSGTDARAQPDARTEPEVGNPPPPTPDAGAMSDAMAPPDASCNHEMMVIVRDFRGYAAASGPRHPDFEGTFRSYTGIVEALLGADQKPIYAPTGATPATTGKTEFDQWYRDVAGINLRFPVTLPLTEDAARPGVYVYDDQEFFPIDGLGWMDGFGHNFHFTTEIHLQFSYRGGELFTFIGDDDLFLFINGHLAIDLGGVHPAQTGSVNLDDQAAAFGIEKGRSYPMDIFHAERHTDYSTFRIETTIQCITSIIIS